MSRNPVSPIAAAVLLLAVGTADAASAADVCKRYQFGPAAPPSAIAVVNGPLRRGDVPLSPRVGRSTGAWTRPFEQFGANRILWTYSGPALMPEATHRHIPVQCTLDFWVPQASPQSEAMVCTNHSGGYGGFASDALQTSNGARRPDINSEEWRAYQLDRSKQLVDAGCTSFQQDVAWLNAEMSATDGCYSTGSVDKFRAYLRATLSPQQLAALGVRDLDTFDYRTQNLAALKPYFAAFQKQATSDYHRWLHGAIRQYAHAKCPALSVEFSGNVSEAQLRNGRSSWLAQDFDFLISEAHGTRTSLPGVLREMAVAMRDFHETSAVTFPSNDVWLNQRAIASAYALGLVPVIPWDVYVSAGTPRFYGEPADFAPLYAMVQTNRQIFDEYESTGDWYGSYEFVLPAEGYVERVDARPHLLRAIVRWAQPGAHKTSEAVLIGGRQYTVTAGPQRGVVDLPNWSRITAGEPVLSAAPGQYLITVRVNAHQPRNKVVHVVNWGMDSGPIFLALKQRRFASPPAALVTPSNPRPVPAPRQAIGDYYIYRLDASTWTVLSPS